MIIATLITEPSTVKKCKYEPGYTVINGIFLGIFVITLVNRICVGCNSKLKSSQLDLSLAICELILIFPTFCIMVVLSTGTTNAFDDRLCRDGISKGGEFNLILLWIYTTYGLKILIGGFFYMTYAMFQGCFEGCGKMYKTEKSNEDSSLSEQFDTKSGKGAKRQGHLALSKEKYDPKTFLMDTCVLCRARFKLDAEITGPLDCGRTHLFHSSCLANWLENHDECPYCKENIDLETIRID